MANRMPIVRSAPNTLGDVTDAPFRGGRLFAQMRHAGLRCILGCAMVAFVGGASCRRTEPTVRIGSPALAPGLVARVGPLSISAQTVEATARAAGCSATEALHRVVQDALLAAEGHAALARHAELGLIEATVWARVLLQDIRARARERGLPSDEELAAATERRWLELDRPPSARTTHALARIKRPQQAAEAREVAGRIARATHGALDADDFKRRALAVKPGAIEVVVEALPPITEDGRTVPVGAVAADPAAKFDARFARACHAIARPGEQSDPVESGFGWHVILLEERLPAVRIPAEERRRMVADEVYRERARRERDRLVEVLRAQAPVVVARNATELTGLLKAPP